MRIVSFSWTTESLIAGRKTVTRRDWSHDYARRLTAFAAGEAPLIQAFDRSPRSGGQPVAIIRLRSIRHELDRDAPDDDYDGEGFGFIFARNLRAGSRANPEIADRASPAGFDHWRFTAGERRSYVVRFRLVDLTEAGRAIRARLERVCPDLLRPVPLDRLSTHGESSTHVL